MKLKYAGILIILVLFSNVICGQDFWELLSFPDTTHIRCIAVDENENIFIGAGGNGLFGGVYHSSNMGVTWEVVLNSDSFSVQSIAIDENGIIYIGKTGFNTFMISENSGDTWEAINLPAFGNIVKILPHKSDTLFISTWEDNGALLLRSTDLGENWDSIFTSNRVSEYISDILVSNSGVIYISLTAYHQNMGGIYKSLDGGDNWEFIGLLNHQVTSLDLNNFNDLFAGSWGGLTDTTSSGLFVLRDENENWDTLLAGPQVSDMAINSENHIYLAGSGPNGVVRSIDDGENFELINDGLPEGAMRNLFIDDYHYIYVTNLSTLARSINPTVSIFEEFSDSQMKYWSIYPNPTCDILNIVPKKDIHDYKIKNVVVYNLFGGIVKSWNSITDETCAINLNGLATGTYFLEINSSNYRTITKIIIN